MPVRAQSRTRFKHLPSILLLAGVLTMVAVLTLPRLVTNYGADGDAMRGVRAALSLAETGEYSPSRLPGNPLFEYVLAVLAPWGRHIATNLFVLATYCAGVVGFWLLTRGRPHRELLTALLAFTPILLVNAVSTMDYLPGLAAIVWCCVLADRRRLLLSAVCLCLAVGFRFSNIVFLLPVSLFLVLRRSRRRDVGMYWLLGGFAGLVLYAPILARFGPRMFALPPSYLSTLLYAGRTIYNGVMLFGPPATVAFVVVCLARRGEIIRSSTEAMCSRSGSFALELSAVAVFALLYLAHSDESAYLIPVIPFVYLLVGRWFSAPQLAVCGLLVVSQAVLTVQVKGGEGGKRQPVFRLERGSVIQDYVYRSELELLRNGIGRFDADRAVILTGIGPQLTEGNPWLVQYDYRQISTQLVDEKMGTPRTHRLIGRDVYLVYMLSAENVRRLQADGFQVFVFSPVALGLARTAYGYDPDALGVTRVPVLGGRTFYKTSQ